MNCPQCKQHSINCGRTGFFAWHRFVRTVRSQLARIGFGSVDCLWIGIGLDWVVWHLIGDISTSDWGWIGRGLAGLTLGRHQVDNGSTSFLRWIDVSRRRVRGLDNRPTTRPAVGPHSTSCLSYLMNGGMDNLPSPRFITEWQIGLRLVTNW